FEGGTGLEWADFSSVEHMCNMRFYTYSSNPLAYAKDLHINGELVTELVIPSTVQTVTANSFYGCDGIKSLTISGSVETIGRSAFQDCVGLTQITIPASVTSILANAFSGCTELTRINVYGPTPDVSPIAFDDVTYSRAALYIPENSLEEYLMTNWALFRRIYVGSVATKTLTDGVFRYRVLENPDNIEALLIQGDYSALTEANIPVSFVDDDPDNFTEYVLTGIGASAFEGCTGLTSVTFSRDAQINIIAAKAFSGCTGITGSIDIPNSVSSIGANAFDGCSSITAVSIGNSVTSIGEYAFRGCNALTKADFPSLEHLCAITFGDTNANPLSCAGHLYVGGSEVVDLVVPNSITAIGDATFTGCTALQSVTIPESVTTIGANAFYYSHGFKTLSLPNTLEEIGYKAFDACRGITELTIPNSVTSLGAAAFTACTGLRKVTIGHSLTSISKNAFDNCTSLTEVVMPPTITEIGDYAFWACTGLSEIVLPPSVETIGIDAFFECLNLVKVVMGSRVKSIGDMAFSGVPVANLYITAPTPPEASDNVFDEYSGDLYLQGNPAGYTTATCWSSFHYRQAMVEAIGLTMDTPLIAGRAGDTFRLTATMAPANATLQNVYWRSTHPEIASVDQNGVVTLHVDSPEFRTMAAGDAGVCKIVAETLYANGPVAEAVVSADVADIALTGVDEVDGGIDYALPYDVYNMQGVRLGGTIDTLAPGFYILRQGTNVARIIK
ncbi:MAG: leucine-rich repeat protein, partial [Paramuribaculum sp.]|nr:leucine-rich repeat protein [Paramuribaculum sp.]